MGERSVMNREELAEVGRWVTEVEEELRRMREGGYAGTHRPATLTSVLQDLAAGR